MTDDRVQFTYAAGEAAAEAVNQSARTLTQQVQDLLESLKPIKADWYQSGSVGAGAAQQMENKLTSATDDMVTLIHAFGNTITTNTQTAQHTDNSISSMFT
jgi:uncharacterized protein YukE